MVNKPWPSLATTSNANAFDKRTRKIQRLYSNRVVQQIAEQLPGFASPKAEATFAKEFREWADGYLRWQEFQVRHRPDALRRVAEAARKLEDAYRAVQASDIYSLANTFSKVARLPETPSSVLLLSWEAESRLTAIMEGVALLQEAAARAGSEVGPPKLGRPGTNIARTAAVMALAWLYFTTTGLRPTRIWRPETEKFDSPFRRFCIAALKPIDGNNVARGIDGVIQRGLSAARAYEQKFGRGFRLTLISV